MSDSVKKYYEMQEEKELVQSDSIYFLWILDYEAGRVFMYNIRRADLEPQDYEDLMVLKGHKPTNCDWMICESNKIYS